jgi:hypothetical protein
MDNILSRNVVDFDTIDSLGFHISSVLKELLNGGAVETKQVKGKYNIYQRLQSEGSQLKRAVDNIKTIKTEGNFFRYFEPYELEALFSGNYEDGYSDYIYYLPPFRKESLSLISDEAKSYFEKRTKKEGMIYTYTKLANSVLYANIISMKEVNGRYVHCYPIRLMRRYLDTFDDTPYKTFGTKVEDFEDSVAMVRIHTMLYLTFIYESFDCSDEIIKEITDFMVFDSPHYQCRKYSQAIALFNATLMKYGGYPMTRFYSNSNQYAGYQLSKTWFDPVDYEYTQIVFDEGITALLELGLDHTVNQLLFLRDAPPSKENLRLMNMILSFQFCSGYTVTDEYPSFVKQVYGKDNRANEVVEKFGFDERTRIENNKQYMKEYIREADDDDKVISYFEQFVDKSEIFDYIDSTYENDHSYPYTLERGVIEVLDEFIDYVEAEMDLILINLIKHDELLWDKKRMEKYIFDIQTSGSSGGFKGDYIFDVPVEGIKSIPVRKKNIFTVFAFEELVDMDEELFKKVVMETATRTVPGGKRTRAIMMDAIIHYVVSFIIRNGLDLVMKKFFRYKKGSGNPILDFNQQLTNSTDYRTVELGLDFGTYDGSIKHYLRTGLRASTVKHLSNIMYDETRSFADLLIKSKMTRYKQPLVVKTSKGALQLLLPDMIQSGQPDTAILTSVINTAFQNLLSSKLARHGIEVLQFRVQGDDSGTGISINGEVSVDDTTNTLVYEEDKYNIEFLSTINQESFDVSTSIGMETNEKGGLSSNSCIYLQVTSMYGRIVGRPRIQPFCVENPPDISEVNIIESLTGLERLMIERGYKQEFMIKYILLFYCIRFMWRKDDYFYQLPLTSIFTPKGMGGPGYVPMWPSLHAFPNYDIYIQYNLVKHVSLYQRIRKYSSVLSNNSNPVLDEITEKIFNNQGELKIKYNWLGYKTSEPRDISYLILNPDLVEKAKKARDTSKIKVPSNLYYPDKPREYVKKVVSSISSVSKAKRIFNQINADSIIKNMNGRTETPLSTIDKILYYIEYDILDYSDFVNNGSDPNPFVIAEDFISRWYHYTGVANVDNMRSIDVDNIARVLRDDPNYNRSIDTSLLIRTLTRPDVLYNDYEFELVLEQIGIDISLAQRLIKELKSNALSYLLVADDYGYSTISQSLGFFDLSEAMIDEHIDLDSISDRVVKTVFAAVILMDIQKHMVNENVPIQYEVTSNINNFKRFSTRFTLGNA